MNNLKHFVGMRISESMLFMVAKLRGHLGKHSKSSEPHAYNGKSQKKRTRTLIDIKKLYTEKKTRMRYMPQYY